jgi:beta-xylosidase
MSTTQPAVRFPWNPDLGDGNYANPILCADYSDPDVIRVGEDFYLTASSFTDTPGLPILHSKDLVNWTIIGHAIKNVPHPRYADFQPGCGVWAPAIRHHDGKFWIFFPTPDEGIYVTTAEDPKGPWCEPWMLIEGKGLIDPCPLWDDDGKAYLVHAYANSRAGIKHKLRVRPMSPDGKQILGEGEIVWDDPTNHPTCEGPKFHKFNGLYYISAPAGGVATGWQLILRSKNVYGPYEGKVVLAQGSTPINGPHQGAIVDMPSGEWWFVHFQESQPYGRICHLQPVVWKDGWPLMGINQDAAGKGEPVLIYRKPKVTAPFSPSVPQTSDEFDYPSLGLQWQWHANHQADWHSLSSRKGHLRLFALPQKEKWSDSPNLLLQKTPAREFSLETHVELSTATIEAGLVAAGLSSASIAIVQEKPGAWKLVYRIDDQIIESHPLQTCSAKLQLAFADGGQVDFSFTEPGASSKRMSKPFRAVEGRWIGAKVGIYCFGEKDPKAFADFDYFRFASP